MAEKDFEADDLELKDYAFEPKTYTVNDVQITDYTGIEHDKIFLVNKKDILTKPRPSWIPELDENCLEREDFLPHCVKDSDGYYFVQKTSLEVPEDYNGPKLSDYEKRQKFTKKTYYKMSLDLIAATCDYYIKKRRAEIKLSGDTHRVGFPRSAGSMTWARYDDMVSMFSLCEAYKDDPEITKNYGHIKARRSNPKHKGYIRQTEIAFHDHYEPLLQELKDKKLDMNLQKQDAADTHKKGEETSYGMSGRSDTLKKDYGVTIKKQNGTSFDSQQLKNIREALENVWNHYGKLDDVAIAFNLGISYAANTLQHARKAVGIFHPEYHAIGVSFFEERVADSKDSSMVLCHEVAHWLDFEKGNRDHFHYASDKTGTLENKIALKFKELVRKRNSGGKKLGDYWYRTCECLARAMEEDYGLKHDCYDFYNDQAYLTPEVFKKEIAPLVEQLLKENRKYFNLVKKEKLSQELSTAKDLSFSEEVKNQPEKKEEKNIENESFQQPEQKKVLSSLSSDDSFVSDFRSGKFNSIFDRLSDLNFKDDFVTPSSLYSRPKVEGINNLWLELFKNGVPPTVIKFENEWEMKIEEVNLNAPFFKEKWIEEASKAENEKLLSYFSKMSVPDENVISEHNGHLFRTMIINAIAKQSRFLTEYTDPFNNIALYQKPESLLEKRLRYEIIENEIKKRGLKIMQDKEIENNKEISEKKTRWFSVHYKQIAEDRAEFLDHIHKNQEIENLDIHKTLLENHLEIQGCILGGTGMIDSAYESFVCSGADGFKYLLTPHNSNHYKTENKIIVSDKIFDSFEDAVKACIEEEIKVYKPEITDYKIAEDSGYFFRMPEKYRDFILDYILENKKDIVTEAEDYAAKNNISEKSQKEKLRHYIGISMEGYNKYRFDNPEWSKIIDNHAKQIENPLFYQNEKTVPEADEKEAGKTKYKANDQKYISKFLDKDGITIDFERWTKKDNPTSILGNNYELSLQFPITKNVLDCFVRFVIDETEPDGTFIKNHVDFTSEEFINSISSYYNERNEHYPDQDEFDAIRWKYITDGQKLVRLGFTKIRDIDSDITDALIKTGRENFKDELGFYKKSSRQNCRVFKLDDNAENPLYIIHNFETQQYSVLQDVNPENPGVTYFHAEGYPELDGLLLHLGERTNLSAEESKKFKYFECPSLNIKFTPELLLEKKALDYDTIEYYKNNSGFEMSFYNKLKEAVSLQKNNDFSIDNSKEKPEPVQQDLFEISENNKEYWITDKDGNRITNSDAKKIIKDNLDLLNRLSEEKTPAANSKMVTASYISDYLLERLNKEDAQEVKGFTESFYYNIRNDYLSSLSDDRIAILLGKGSGSGFSFNESEANFFRKNLEKKLVGNDYFIGTLQTVVNDFSKEWSDTLERENPHLISLLKKACDESVDYESRLYTAYLSYHYKHDPDDVAGYSLETFKDKIVNDRTLMEKYLSAYPEFEKLHNEYIEHNKISKKENLVSIFSNKDLSNRVSKGKKLIDEYLEKYFEAKNVSHNLIDLYAVGDAKRYVSVNYNGSFYKNLSKEQKKQASEFNEKLEQVLKEYASKRLAEKKDEPEEAKAVSDLYKWARNNHPFADFTDSVIEEICFGMWEAEDKILLKEHEEQFPDIKYPAYPGTEWVLKVIEKHRDEYKDADFTVLSDTLVKEIEAEKINNQKKIEFLKKELDNKEYPLSKTEASDINENIRRFESLTDEDFKNLVLWKQRMLKESEARRNAVFEDILEKEKRKSSVQEGEMFSYNDLHPSVTVINRKTNRQTEIRPTGTSAKNLMQLCGLKNLSEADELIQKIQAAGFSILSTDARIILYNDEKYYDFRENHASYNFATREFEYDEDKRNLKIWDFRDYIKKGLKITKKMKEFEKIENLGGTKMEHKYTFFVKDTAEFEQFADFEPVTNLTAEQAVKKYAELRKDGYSCGIGMHIPGDFIFDDPDGNGITLVVNHEGTAVFDIYGDTFIDQLQEKDIENGRARLYIDLYKELYNAFESEGVSVKKPQFVFDKESELFTENKNLSHKGISFYEWAKKDPEDSRSLEYIICNKDSKAYFDDSQTISNNLMNFLRNSEFVNADYSDDKITVTLNFDDESFEMCQNELVKLDIDWGLEHRIHQVITYSRDTLDDDKQAFVSLEEAQAAAKDYLSNDYYKDENGKPYYDGVCVLNNKTKEIEFTQGLFPSKEIFSLDILDKNNFELTPNEISNKIENIYGYFFEYESNENTVDIYQYEKNENGSINKEGPQNFIGSLDSEGNFGFTDDYTEKLPDAVGQAAAMYFREITKSVSAEIELEPEDSYYELFRDKVTGKLISEELNQMGFVKDPDGNYVLDDIKVSLSLVYNNKENPALIISHISDPAVMQTIHLNDSYAKKHSLGMSFKDLLESGWLKETKNPNLKSFIDGNMLERDFIGKYIPDADNNKAVTLLDDITAYEDGFSDVLKSFKDFKDAWDIPVSSEQEVFEFGGKLQKALYNAAEAIKDKKAYADSLLRYAEKYKPGMEDPDNVYGKFKFHEDELKVFLKVNMINASIYNMATDINKNGTQIVFALMSSKDKRHYGYITADFDDPANCKYNFTDLKDHNLDISLTENISKMRDFCEKGKPFYGASENHSVNIELTSDGSKLSLTFNEVPDIDLRSSLNWAGFKYSTLAKAWKADFNQENSDKLLATVKKYWPDDYEHAAKQMEGIGTKPAAEHKKESISVDFSQIENTSEKLAENIKFINEKYPEYKGNLTHILTDIMFNATSKNRNEILDKFRDCNNKDELNSKLKKMVYGSFETEIKKQQNVKPKKDPEEGFLR